MASTRLKTTKTGKRFYEIRVSRGSGQKGLSSRWYVPEGWSQRAIDRELAKVSAEFERKVKAGEIISRAEMHQIAEERKKEEARIAEEKAIEEAKILTFKQFGESIFMPEKRMMCSENTRAYYQNYLDIHVYPEIGNYKISEISSAQLIALLRKKQESGFSHSFMIGLYTVLNLIFKSAYKIDMIDRNPMDKVDRPRQTKEKLKSDAVEAYTEEEIDYIIKCIENEPLRWKTFILLLIHSGMRRGEANGLRWNNVNFSEGTVTICENLCYTKEKGVYVTTPKSGRARMIYLPPEVMDLLRELRASQSIIDPLGYVFTRDNSLEPMDPSSPLRYFKKLEKKYKIEHFHPHKLRHSFATIALSNGADIISVSKTLGHATPTTTTRFYAHSNLEAIKRVGNCFQEALKKKRA